MKKPSEHGAPESLREGVIGLGGRSMRKSYFGSLRERLDELARFRALLDATSEAIAVIELPSLRIVDANRSADQRLGWRAGGTLDVGAHVVRGGPTLIERLSLESDAGDPVVALSPGAADGQRWFEISVHHEVHGDGCYAVLVARDVTDARRAADELRRAKERAEAGERAWAEFLSIAAHELRTPVTGILLMLQGTARRLARGERVTTNVLARLVRQAERLGQLVNDLLDVSRLEHGRLPLRPARVDLVEVVTEVVDQARASASGNPIRIDAPGVVHAECDPARIAQVVSNLLENAVKYSPPGGPVVVAVRQEGGTAEIAVTDSGPGLSDAEQRRLFEPFVRLHHAEQREPGLGLGLHISHRLAALHGGRLEVRSAKGRGATFTLKLPTR